MFDIKAQLEAIVLSIPAILVAFTFHEYAHAIIADRLGDKTPRFQGRLTLNPIAHIDPIGFLLFLIARFGWAKPVQTNPNAYKNYYKDDLKVSIAGPLANLLVGFVFSFVYAFAYVFLFKFTNSTILAQITLGIIGSVVKLNCLFFLLNLLPLPGFDGFHVLRDLFPKAFYRLPEEIYTYQLFIFVALAMPVFGGNSILSYIIGAPAEIISYTFVNFAFKLFGI